MSTQSRYSSLKSADLLSGIQRARSEEKRILTDLLQYLLEIDRRKAHLEWGYSSLFVFLCDRLGYEKASAQRRIEALRAMQEIPEIEAQIESGALSLSTISRVRQVIRHESQTRAIPLNEKRDLFAMVGGKSLSQADRALTEVRLSAMQAIFEAKSSERPLPEGKRELRLVLSVELYEKFEKLKDLRSQADFERSPEKLLEWLVELGLEKADPARRELRREARHVKATATVGSAAEPMTTEIQTDATGRQASAFKETLPSYRLLRDQVLTRDDYQCQYVSSITGLRCGSRHALEADHIRPRPRPRAVGGTDGPENLRAYCDAHNRARHGPTRLLK